METKTEPLDKRLNSPCLNRNWAQVCRAGEPFEFCSKIFSEDPWEVLIGDVTPGACAFSTRLVVEMVVVVVLVVVVVVFPVKIGKFTATP